MFSWLFICTSHIVSRQWHPFSERMRGCFLRHWAEVANSLWAPRRATKLIWLAVPIRPSKLLGSQSSHNMSQPTNKVKSKNIQKKTWLSKLSHQHPASFWFKTTIQWYPSLARLKAHRWETQKHGVGSPAGWVMWVTSVIGTEVLPWLVLYI